MEKLCYETLKKIGNQDYVKKTAPERVLQFGEGNFLRAFVDYFLDVANEEGSFDGKVVLVQPIEMGLTDLVNSQDGLYTLYLRGSEHGQKVDDRRLISCVSRCIDPYRDFDALLRCAENPDLEIIVSNTTEAGIVYDPACRFEDRPQSSFPGKLTRLLYQRFLAFGGAKEKQPVILSCELIDNNGKELKQCVLRYIAQWALPEAFREWTEECVFCSTLVDRIVPGRIRDPKQLALLEQANGYHDDLIDVGECFGVWIIEGPAWLEDKLPFRKAGLNVHVVPDVTPYKKRKVRILNGAHTSMVLGAYLAGLDIVRDCMYDPVIRGFMNKLLYEEVIPTLSLPKEDLKAFAASVQDRFANPFVDHKLLTISLNSTSKWRARCMPSFLEYVNQEKKMPSCLTVSMAAYIAFYSCDIQRREENALICRRPAGDEYAVMDDSWVLDFYMDHHADSAEALTDAVLGNTRMWGQDLREIPGFAAAVCAALKTIRQDGAKQAFAQCL